MDLARPSLGWTGGALGWRVGNLFYTNCSTNNRIRSFMFAILWCSWCIKSRMGNCKAYTENHQQENDEMQVRLYTCISQHEIISLKSQKETLLQNGPVSPTPFFRVWKLPWRTCLCTTFVSSSPLGLVWSQQFFWACWRMSARAARIQQFLARTVFAREWGNCKQCAETNLAWMELNFCMWPSILKVDSYVICLLFSTIAMHPYVMLHVSKNVPNVGENKNMIQFYQLSGLNSPFFEETFV